MEGRFIDRSVTRRREYIFNVWGFSFYGTNFFPIDPVLSFSEQTFFYSFFVCFVCFLGPYPRHMEVPRLGVELELQPQAYTMATATPDPSLARDLQLMATPDP